MRRGAAMWLTLFLFPTTTPSLAAMFDCSLADERLRYLAKEVEKDGKDYVDLKKQLQDLNIRSLNERQTQQLARLKMDVQYIRKMMQTRTTELGKEMSRIRRAGCDQLTAMLELEERVEAAAQKVLKDQSP